MSRLLKISKNKGMGLVEIIVGSAIISVGILAIIAAYSVYINYALANQKNIQSSFLLEEGLEVMTFMRDDDWDNIGNLNDATTYYLLFDGTDWTLTTTPQYIDGEFLREINVSSVNRNISDLISQSGTNDPETKKITVTVSSYQGHGTTTQSVLTYLTNIRE